jgi:proteasome accessory factor C
VLRQDGRAIPLEPSALRRLVTEGVRAARRAHEGPAFAPAPERDPVGAPPVSERQAGPVAPERFGVLQSLLAYLLAACGENASAVITAAELVERFSIPAEALEEHLSLLNLVNFGGGCYAVYTELHGEQVHIDKELFGDTFRRAPRLTPLEARAVRLALEFVGPMISAGSSSPLERVRAKLEEAFGAFDLAQTPTPQGGPEEDLVATLTKAINQKHLVELEYLKPDSVEIQTRTVEPYGIERRLPHWYVHTWDVDRDAPRSYRLDRARTAKLLGRTFDRREGFDRAELHSATTAQVWYSPAVARWEVEKGARPLIDGAALADRTVGSVDWLVGEVLAFGGEAVVIAPAELRARIAQRARELERELRAARSDAAAASTPAEPAPLL